MQALLDTRGAAAATLLARQELARRLAWDLPLDRLKLASPPELPPPVLAGVDDLVAAAARQRLDLAAARADVEAAARRIESEEAAAWRIFDFGAHVEDETETAVGPALAIELPFFDQNRAQIAKARFEHAQTVERLRGLERGTRVHVESALLAWKQAVELEGLYAGSVVAERERALELAREAFQLGRLPTFAVLDAERALRRARVGLLDARLARRLAEVEVERAAGGRLPAAPTNP
jgi:cobalt-zinc-cadmium efflux system outer membrane protein